MIRKCNALFIIFGYYIAHCAGCGANGDGAITMTKAKFKSVDVGLYSDAKHFKTKPRWKVVTDAQAVDRIAKCFNCLNETSEYAGGWTAFAELIFTEEDGTTRRVLTDFENCVEVGKRNGDGTVSPAFWKILRDLFPEAELDHTLELFQQNEKHRN